MGLKMKYNLYFTPDNIIKLDLHKDGHFKRSYRKNNVLFSSAFLYPLCSQYKMILHAPIAFVINVSSQKSGNPIYCTLRRHVCQYEFLFKMAEYSNAMRAVISGAIIISNATLEIHFISFYCIRTRSIEYGRGAVLFQWFFRVPHSNKQGDYNG